MTDLRACAVNCMRIITSLSIAMESLASRVRQSSRKRPRDGRELCPHCDQYLSIKTFKRHRTLFQKGDGTWIPAATTEINEEAESKAISLGLHKIVFPTISVIMTLSPDPPPPPPPPLVSRATPSLRRGSGTLQCNGLFQTPRLSWGASPKTCMWFAYCATARTLCSHYQPEQSVAL